MIYEKRAFPHAAVGTDAYGFLLDTETTGSAGGGIP